MNPYPFASLNHFTVPAAIQHLLHHGKERAEEALCSHPVLAQLRSHRSTADQLALGLAPSPGQKTGRTCDRRRTHEHPDTAATLRRLTSEYRMRAHASS